MAVIIYNGRDLPFDDATFDVVYSSNTLEHIAHVRDFQAEIQRVGSSSSMALLGMSCRLLAGAFGAV